MRRNTITIIELIIILCVIVVAVRVWNYKFHKAVYTPIPIASNTLSFTPTPCNTLSLTPPPTPTPVNYPTLKHLNEKCPECGKMKIYERCYEGMEQSGQMFLMIEKKCNNCGWQCSTRY
jgi:predicted RNA-binding Zn-ribbon protein involved in translation (DUF1610 family)